LFLLNKWYFDELYDRDLRQPDRALAIGNCPLAEGSTPGH
jgi:hypothetical protein